MGRLEGEGVVNKSNKEARCVLASDSQMWS